MGTLERMAMKVLAISAATLLVCAIVAVAMLNTTADFQDLAGKAAKAKATSKALSYGSTVTFKPVQLVHARPEERRDQHGWLPPWQQQHQDRVPGWQEGRCEVWRRGFPHGRERQVLPRAILRQDHLARQRHRP